MSGEAPPQFEETLVNYLSDISKANTEAAKAYLFLEFLRKTFRSLDVDYAEQLYPDLERNLKQTSTRQGKTLAIRGRVDAFLGNLIIEFKKSLNDRSLVEAESEVKRYVSILWSKQAASRPKYLALVTDGDSFRAFRPRAPSNQLELLPDEIVLDAVDSAELTTLNPGDAFVWLDRYALTKNLKPVTTESFSKEFGLNKPGHKDAASYLKEAWKKGKEEVLYRQWASFLRIVYGSAVDNEDLFLRHTYLSVLAKLLAYSSISGGVLPVSTSQIREILEGKTFEKWNVHNFLEEDFFSWVARSEEGVIAARILLDRLSTYDLTTIDEDVLKSLYQDLVDPQSRHDLGEYYTPDWLAEIMVEKSLSGEPRRTVLDPSCGSGTFLAAAIRLKRELLRELPPGEQLEVILQSVKGVDVHPLAVTLARTNYLISLGSEMLSARKGAIYLPVYLADSVHIPDTKPDYYSGSGIECFKIDAEGEILWLPVPLTKEPTISDACIEIVKEYSLEISQGNRGGIGQLKGMIKQRFNHIPPELSDASLSVLDETASTMAKLIKEGKDTIWSFILKNIYKPLFLKDNKSDIVIGNPPWLSYRYIENRDYQKFLKKLIIEDYNLLALDRGELITQMELASLFLSRTMDLYLKDGGVISMVMPRSLFVADQHDNFRRGIVIPQMRLVEVFDLESVSPLFKVPSCVVTATQGPAQFPVKTVMVNGQLKSKNAKKAEAMANLNFDEKSLTLYHIGERTFFEDEKLRSVMSAVEKGKRSVYYKNFTQGATIVPRQLWFVDLVIHQKLGIDPTKPNVKTSNRAIDWAKEEYSDVRQEGQVESKFLFHVVTGSELLPFATKSLPIAVLPIVPADGKYSVIKADDARRNGWNGLSSWLTGAEQVWRIKRGEKAGKLSVYQWLDYSRKLTLQSSRTRYKVLYNTSGTYLAACVIENKPSSIRVDSSEIRINGVIADAKSYWFDTDGYDEASFIVAMLNAPIIDSLIKPMQSRGLWGERDIHKKVLELPIPKFEKNNELHMKLAKYGKSCSLKAQKIVARSLESNDYQVGKLRQIVKKELSTELGEIDSIVRKLLGEMGNNNSYIEDYK